MANKRENLPLEIAHFNNFKHRLAFYDQLEPKKDIDAITGHLKLL